MSLTLIIYNLINSFSHYLLLNIHIYSMNIVHSIRSKRNYSSTKILLCFETEKSLGWEKCKTLYLFNYSLAKLGDFHLPPLAGFESFEELMDVVLRHNLAFLSEALQELIELGLHGVVALDSLHLLDPVHLWKSFHTLIKLVTLWKDQTRICLKIILMKTERWSSYMLLSPD